MGDFRRASPFYSFIANLSRPFVRLLLRLRATGLENVPQSGGFVVASNHASNIDPWPLGFPLLPRQVHYMGKAELYRNPILRWILLKIGTFPVRRGERDPESFKTAVKYAREGGVVAMFPEGTRRAKGLRKRHVATPHPGAARIALSAGVPLVPAAIVGTDRLRSLRPVRVAYGPPVDLGDTNGMSRQEAGREATKRLMAEIGRLEASLVDQ
jgi:1-acyl-sn-glycerol-3-phosphate acyltransferase